jgi:hypothetical protein
VISAARVAGNHGTYGYAGLADFSAGKRIVNAAQTIFNKLNLVDIVRYHKLMVTPASLTSRPGYGMFLTARAAGNHVTYSKPASSTSRPGNGMFFTVHFAVNHVTYSTPALPTSRLGYGTTDL